MLNAQSYIGALFLRKPDFCICENKDADQLCSNCTADQRICFRYMDKTIPCLRLSKISSFKLSSDCTGWFALELVGNPEAAHTVTVL